MSREDAQSNKDYNKLFYFIEGCVRDAFEGAKPAAIKRWLRNCKVKEGSLEELIFNSVEYNFTQDFIHERSEEKRDKILIRVRDNIVAAVTAYHNMFVRWRQHRLQYASQVKAQRYTELGSKEAGFELDI